MSMVTVCIGDVVPFGERGSECRPSAADDGANADLPGLPSLEYQGYVGGIWGVASVLGYAPSYFASLSLGRC